MSRRALLVAAGVLVLASAAAAAIAEVWSDEEGCGGPSHGHA